MNPGERDSEFFDHLPANRLLRSFANLKSAARGTMKYGARVRIDEFNHQECRIIAEHAQSGLSRLDIHGSATNLLYARSMPFSLNGIWTADPE
jgi:hypothetical protein